jgi:glycosidase
MKIVMTDVFARGEDARQLEQWLQATEQAYGGHGYPIYFLDNHDMSRFTDWATGQGPERLLAAVTFMATLRGPMVLFYGTETGIYGGQAQPGFTDSSRIPMPWDELDEALIGKMRQVIAMKREYPVLQRGARLPLHADETTVIMVRQDDDHQALVAANTGTEPSTVSFQFSGAEGAAFEAVVGTAPEGDGSQWRWEIPPLTTAVAIRPAR